MVDLRNLKGKDERNVVRENQGRGNEGEKKELQKVMKGKQEKLETE